jgi:hypothetical protein
MMCLRVWIDGTNPQDPADAGVEANLDVQYAFGLSFPVNVRHLSLRSLIQSSDGSLHLGDVLLHRRQSSLHSRLRYPYGYERALFECTFSARAYTYNGS